jgi:hypothetical protein
MFDAIAIRSDQFDDDRAWSEVNRAAFALRKAIENASASLPLDLQESFAVFDGVWRHWLRDNPRLPPSMRKHRSMRALAVRLAELAFFSGGRLTLNGGTGTLIKALDLVRPYVRSFPDRYPIRSMKGDLSRARRVWKTRIVSLRKIP